MTECESIGVPGILVEKDSTRNLPPLLSSRIVVFIKGAFFLYGNA